MLVFDFEVFKYDWLVVIKNMATGQYTTIVNDVDKLRSFYEENKNNMFIGFNTKRYDDYIFKGILLGADPYYISNVIIEEDNPRKLYYLYKFNTIPLYSLDISQDEMGGSLKEFEGYLGLNISESSVPFNINRSLTQQELDETIEYCKHDVDATEYLAKFRIEAIKSKLNLISEFKLSKADVSNTNAQLVAKILKAKRHSYKDELTPFDLSKLNINIRNSEITKFYTENDLDYDETLKVNIAGVEHVLAYGGLHGALEHFTHEGEIWLLDVASYYPSMMIQYDYLSRNVTAENRQQFKDIYWERLQMKKRGEKKKSTLYKLVLNTTYGCMKSQYNDLYDPKNANNICIAGQLMLIDLIENLEPYCKLIQSNTDGICIIPFDKDKINEVVKDWEERTRMVMELEVATAIYQKDVNNYILVKEKDIKVRGGYVAQSKLGSNNSGGNTIRNTASIIDDAVVNYFVNKVTPEQTIMERNDLSAFQIITKTGRTYDYTVWEKDNREIPANKCNRVYATIDKSCGKLYKVKPNRRDSIANLPEHCMIDNDNIFNINYLDKQWYIAKAWQRIKDFKGEI